MFVTLQTVDRQRVKMCQESYILRFGRTGQPAHFSLVTRNYLHHTAMNETRLFAKPRFAAFESSRPSGVMPARFLPSIALPPRTNSACRSARRKTPRAGIESAV
jgi:hypothetical protein